MELQKMRKKIDLIDYEMLKLLNQRMEYVLRLKKLKSSVTDTDRELEVFQHIRRFSQHLIKPEFSEKIFREIIKESKRLQEQDIKVVGFQGEHGAYSEVAALSYEPALVPIPCVDFVDVFEGVKNNQLDYGIVPVENSLEGAVAQVNDLLIETDLKITGEISIPIHHHLLAIKETDYRDIRVVYSHPQALAQCHGFISRNKLDPRPFYDTAGAAKMLAAKGARSIAAISSALCAELYNLDIIKENIEDHESNKTRFLVLSAEPSKAAGNKCSMIFQTRHEAGALFRVLRIFSDADINLTRIESRPVRKEPGQYAFLLDFLGSDTDAKIRGALEKVKKETAMFKFMGCYKEAVK
ncbi:MAG: prephenate dehydratase [Planctomycetes bacterium]|nr:prephenate dehydratase [Planctomycetota bacterium]